jgi:CheY-like chemotaxis protein
MRVLIVEDEGLIALDLEGLVEAMGHEACGWATRAGEALRLARETAPDLVLMDVQLAGGDSGLDAARAISAELPVRMVFLTANPALVDAAALPFRPAGVVPKPLSEPALRSALKE